MPKQPRKRFYQYESWKRTSALVQAAATGYCLDQRVSQVDGGGEYVTEKWLVGTATVLIEGTFRGDYEHVDVYTRSGAATWDQLKAELSAIVEASKL